MSLHGMEGCADRQHICGDTSQKEIHSAPLPTGIS